MLRLYHHPRSTFGRRVRIQLLEKDIPHESVVVDMAARGHKSPEYLARNPYGRVPMIDDDGFVLFESAAILLYLEATRPAPPLIPADPQGRALVDMHLRLCDGQLGRHAGAILFPKRFMPPARWDRAAMEQSRVEIQKHLDVLEQSFGEGEYLVRDAFSLADVAYLPFLQFLALMEVQPGPRVAAWATRLLARPSALATVPDV